MNSKYLWFISISMICKNCTCRTSLILDHLFRFIAVHETNIFLTIYFYDFGDAIVSFLFEMEKFIHFSI